MREKCISGYRLAVRFDSVRMMSSLRASAVLPLLLAGLFLVAGASAAASSSSSFGAWDWVSSWAVPARQAWDAVPEPPFSLLTAPPRARNDREEEGNRRRQVTPRPPLDISTFSDFVDDFFENGEGAKDKVDALVVSAVTGNTTGDTNSTIKYFGAEKAELKAETLWQVASISKTFTAVAVMQLVEQSVVSLDTDITEYLPSGFEGRWDEKITLRMLMTHVAGFEEQIVGQFTAPGEGPSGVRDLEEYLLQGNPKQFFSPETVPAYSNYAWSLAGLVVETMSKVPYWKYMRDSVFLPLGMTDTFVCCFDGQDYKDKVDNLAPSGAYKAPDEKMLEAEAAYFNYVPAGSVWSTAPDMLKFAKMFLNKGLSDTGPRVLREASVDDMLTAHWGWPIGTGFGVYQIYLNSEVANLHDGDMPTFSSRLLLLPDQNFAMFMSVAAGRAPTRDNLVRELADEFFLPRPLPSLADSLPDDMTSSALANSYLSTRANFKGATKLLFVLSQLTSSPYFFGIKEDKVNLEIFPEKIDLLYEPLTDGGYWFTTVDVLDDKTADSLNESNVDLEWIFGNYPPTNFTFEDKEVRSMTILSSVNGQFASPGISYTAFGVVAGLVILLMGVCCCGCCCPVLSCGFRKLKSRSKGHFVFGPEPGTMALVKNNPLPAPLDKSAPIIITAIVFQFVLVFCNVVGSLGFIDHGPTLVYGPTGATYFLITLPIISIIFYILAFFLSVYMIIFGLGWIEQRVMFGCLVFFSFCFTFWFNDLNLVGDHVWD